MSSDIIRKTRRILQVASTAVRDLDGVRRLGFAYFSTSILPGHCYARFIDYGKPACIAGLDVATGDLLAADQHGVILIPREIPLSELAQGAAQIDSLESEIFALCQSPKFSIERMTALDESVTRRMPKRKQ